MAEERMRDLWLQALRNGANMGEAALKQEAELGDMPIFFRVFTAEGPVEQFVAFFGSREDIVDIMVFIGLVSQATDANGIAVVSKVRMTISDKDDRESEEAFRDRMLGVLDSDPDAFTAAIASVILYRDTDDSRKIITEAREVMNAGGGATTLGKPMISGEEMLMFGGMTSLMAEQRPSADQQMSAARWLVEHGPAEMLSLGICGGPLGEEGS